MTFCFKQQTMYRNYSKENCRTQTKIVQVLESGKCYIGQTVTTRVKRNISQLSKDNRKDSKYQYAFHIFTHACVIMTFSVQDKIEMRVCKIFKNQGENKNFSSARPILS